MKRTLKRGLKVLETVKGEANAAVVFAAVWFAYRWVRTVVCQSNRRTALAGLMVGLSISL